MASSPAALAEDRLLVPSWRTLPAEVFYELHPTYGRLLYRFFAPLTMAAPVAALLAMGQIILQSAGFTPRSLAAIAAAVLTCSLVVIYLLYFMSANEAFARRAVSATDPCCALPFKRRMRHFYFAEPTTFRHHRHIVMTL